MMGLSVELDFTFIEEFLNFLEKPTEDVLSRLVSHEAAKGIYHHAIRFNNTEKNIHGFWEERISREVERGSSYINEILSCMEYIKSNKEDFHRSFKEVESFLPKSLSLSCRLYLIVGYDIGVVSEGDAFLNLGHKLFHQDKRELLYFAMHELHHVGYTHYNPLFSLDTLETNRDLLRIIKYSTHLEGIATYAPLEIRKREEGLTHSDYIILKDPKKRMNVITEFFHILKRLKKEDEQELQEKHYDTLNKMSDLDRLWYISGAHMAQVIDESLGRKALTKTIIEGPNAFFKAYNNLCTRNLNFTLNI